MHKKRWNSKILNSLSTYHLCGVWFRIIFNTEGLKYLQIKAKDIELIRRLNRHYSQFKGLFIRERSWVKFLFKGKNQNRACVNINDVKGFSIWKFWHSSMKVNVERSHQIFEKRELKYYKKGLSKCEFDFSNTPDEIKIIPQQLRDYIQFGILYCFTEFIGGLKT